MGVRGGGGRDGYMSGETFFTQTQLAVERETEEESDAALGALLHLYLRSGFDRHEGCWAGRDEHDTLRRTCHAAETLHRLNLDSHSESMVRDAGNWLINLPAREPLQLTDRQRMRLYPSRFKTLAYLGRFDDAQVRRDFTELLDKERGGMIRGVTESDVLTTCIVLDTLLTLEHAGTRDTLCSDERYDAICGRLADQLKRWRPADAPVRGRRGKASALVSASGAASEIAPAPVLRSTKHSGPICEIETGNQRDLSYVLGLVLHTPGAGLTAKQLTSVTDELTGAITRLDRARSTDLMSVLYAALQLAEHERTSPSVAAALRSLLRDLRQTYATTDTTRRWDLSQHTLVLRLLLTFYGEAPLARNITAHFLHETERLRSSQRDTRDIELRHVIRERVEVELGEVQVLSGGFTQDQVLRVPFTYWYPLPGQSDSWHSTLSVPHEASVIIKRSTSDAFHTATQNYRQLPATLRTLFVRQPSEAQVYKSGLSPAYYLTMEDLANLYTFEHLINEFDQRAMSPQQERLLHAATNLICDASFTLLRESRASQSGHAGFPGTQIARLYLAPIEGKLTRAVARVPWLKHPLQGFIVNDQRYRGLDAYLAVLARHATELQPHHLGLTHGDLHAGNVMLDRACSQLKLIDLDRLSWTGDYLADLGNLLTDVCVYRRVVESHRDFGLSRADIQFVTSAQAAAGTAENVVRYPALGRPATQAVQRDMLDAIAQFAAEIDDRNWKPRLWLASATALLVRLAFQSNKEAAAVLYGEAIRLLHELCRHLEQGHELPALLVPATWPHVGGARGSSEMPDWVAAHEVLRAVHDGLRQLGLRAEADHSSVAYHARANGNGTTAAFDGPLVKLLPPRREGIGRLLLPTGAGRGSALGTLKIVRSSQANDAFGTIVILDGATNPPDVLRLTRSSLNGALEHR